MDKSYQRIIGLGPPVVPLILQAQLDSPDHWGWALAAITGENPVAPEDAGKISRIAEAWVAWGRSKGLI